MPSSQRAREEAQHRRDIMRAREREAAWRRATSTVGGNAAENDPSLKTPRGRVRRSAVSQRCGETSKRSTKSYQSFTIRNQLIPGEAVSYGQGLATMVCV